MIFYSVEYSIENILFLWFISLSIIPSTCIHVVANGSLFFYGWVILCHVCACTCAHACINILFICSLVDGHLRSFPILTTINSAAVTICLHLSFQISVFVFLYIPSSGSYSTSNFYLFGDPSYCLSYWLYQFTFPPTVCKGSLFFYVLSW